VTQMRLRRESAPAEPRPAGGTVDDTGAEPAIGHRRTTWIPALGIVVAVGVVLLLFVLHLTGVLGPGAH
jgi:hypothetical protein